MILSDPSASPILVDSAILTFGELHVVGDAVQSVDRLSCIGEGIECTLSRQATDTFEGVEPLDDEVVALLEDFDHLADEG